MACIGRKQWGGVKICSRRVSYTRKKPLSLAVTQTWQISNSHSRPETQYSSQPAARAFLPAPADWAAAVGWLDVISGYAAVCGQTHMHWKA